MAGPIKFTRSAAIIQVRHRLEKTSMPRLQMSLIVMLTGASGLLFSWLFLKAGVHGMMLRYPLALVAAYGVFLFLLWIWLRIGNDEPASSGAPRDKRSGSNESSLLDGVDVIPSGGGSGLNLSSWGSRGASVPTPGGGNFGGGGASASFDAPEADAGSSGGSFFGGSGSSGGSIDLGDADELVIPLLVAALAIGLALASFYVIYAAPELFAEVLVDGGLAGALYRKMKGEQEGNWMQTAVRKTIAPFLLTGVLVVATGWGLSAHAPGAHTISEALHYVKPLPQAAPQPAQAE